MLASVSASQVWIRHYLCSPCTTALFFIIEQIHLFKPIRFRVTKQLIETSKDLSRDESIYKIFRSYCYG